jgi:hypothetical protein
MKKCAFVRSDTKGTRRCPFGLPITQGCENAGDSVTHMCPLSMLNDEKQGRVQKANARVYIYYKTGERCMYAADIIKSKAAVNCDFGDTAAGMHGPAIVGSPLYAQTFSGIGLDGLYAFPLGFYADNNQSRNLFEGLFSLIGSQRPEIIKEAVLDNPEMKLVVVKLEDGENLTTEEAQDLINAVEKCRMKFEDDRTDSAKADELARKWR